MEESLGGIKGKCYDVENRNQLKDTSKMSQEQHEGVISVNVSTALLTFMSCMLDM